MAVAYFTDPMSDEFRKAIEQAMKEMEQSENGKGTENSGANNTSSRKNEAEEEGSKKSLRAEESEKKKKKYAAIRKKKSVSRKNRFSVKTRRALR